MSPEEQNLAWLMELPSTLAKAGRMTDGWKLGMALRDYRNGTPLEVALGLRGGPRTALTQSRHAQRNRALFEAWCAIPEPDLSPWGRSTRLELEIERFGRTMWPMWREMSCPPEGSSRLRAALWEAFRTGLKIPGTARQLDAIVKKEQALISENDCNPWVEVDN